MPKRISKISSSLKQIADIQVTEWDFMALLNKDIKDLEIAQSLRRLGNIQVMEWDFRTVLPAVDRLANQEVDLVDLVRRTANYRVLEWEFPRAPAAEPEPAPREMVELLHASPSREDIQALIGRLRGFLQYVVVNLIDEPEHAQIKVQEMTPNVWRFKLVLMRRDVAMLIGREGQTASAIRSVLKATARVNGIQALLQIQSHEEEIACMMTDSE